MQAAEGIESGALLDFFSCAPPDLAQRYGVQSMRGGTGAMVMAPGLVPIIVFNRAFGCGLTEPLEERKVEEIIERYRVNGVRRFAIQLTPDARPSDAGDRLLGRGFRHVTNWVRAIRGAEPPPRIATALQIRRIDGGDARSFGRILCSVFKYPSDIDEWVAASVGRKGWSHYCAFDGDVPVATGAMFIRDDVAWLGFAATLPSHQKRGAQGAIMARRIDEAVAYGCQLLVTETGEDRPEKPNPSFHNMLRCGFSRAYLRANYVMEFPASQSSADG